MAFLYSFVFSISIFFCGAATGVLCLLALLGSFSAYNAHLNTRRSSLSKDKSVQHNQRRIASHLVPYLQGTLKAHPASQRAMVHANPQWHSELPWRHVRLRHNMLAFYDAFGDPSSCRSIARLDGCTVRVVRWVNKKGRVKSKFGSKKAAVMVCAQEGRDVLQGESTAYFYFKHGREMEQWYYALRRASSITTQKEDDAETQRQQRQHHYFTHLHAMLPAHSPINADWSNALLGRVFFGVHDSALLLQGLRRKIEGKISRVRKPRIVRDVSIVDLSFGPNMPIFSDMQLRKLTPLGGIDGETTVYYHGGFHLVLRIDFSLEIPLSSRVIQVPVLVTSDLRKLSGRVHFHIAPPPAKRCWIAFEGEPRMHLEIHTEIGRKDKSFLIKDIPSLASIIVNKVKLKILKKMVLPSMDDYPIPHIPKKMRNASSADDSTQSNDNRGSSTPIDDHQDGSTPIVHQEPHVSPDQGTLVSTVTKCSSTHKDDSTPIEKEEDSTLASKGKVHLDDLDDGTQTSPQRESSHDDGDTPVDRAIPASSSDGGGEREEETSTHGAQPRRGSMGSSMVRSILYDPLNALSMHTRADSPARSHRHRNHSSSSVFIRSAPSNTCEDVRPVSRTRSRSFGHSPLGLSKTMSKETPLVPFNAMNRLVSSSCDTQSDPKGKDVPKEPMEDSSKKPIESPMEHNPPSSVEHVTSSSVEHVTSSSVEHVTSSSMEHVTSSSLDHLKSYRTISRESKKANDGGIRHVWTCLICGKRFREERFVDQHITNRHAASTHSDPLPSTGPIDGSSSTPLIESPDDVVNGGDDDDDDGDDGDGNALMVTSDELPPPSLDGPLQKDTKHTSPDAATPRTGVLTFLSRWRRPPT